MKTMYEVIWIDDEWEKMDAFKEECEVIHHIHLHPFRTQKAGMDEFDKNPKKWDGIILDAKMLDESENEVPMLVGLRKAVQHINEKSLQRRVPYFISTGQPDLMSNETFEQSFGSYYIKERDDAKLIEDIKKTANESTRFLVKSYYNDAIEQLRLLNDWGCEKILDILEAQHFPEKKIDPLLYYNPMRQILEHVFRAAHRVGLVPDEFIGKDKNDVNLNQCVQYLSGRNADWLGLRYGGLKDYIVPTHIRDMMFLVLNLGNINSHSSTFNDDELSKLGKYFEENVCNSQYTIYSIALQVCEIVLFMNRYISKNGNRSENLKMCKTFGVIERIDGNDSICVIRSKRTGREANICLSAKYANDKGLIGKKVVILEEGANKNPDTNGIYPYFAIKLQSLEKENGSK